MIASILTALLFVLSLPGNAFAWGPLTHSYLAHEVLACASLLPAGIFGLLTRYRKDFLYGNVVADVIIGKKYLKNGGNSHDWKTAFRLLEQAVTGSEKAFVYGFLCHLAADTVAHEALTDDKTDAGHTWAEFKADGMISKVHWLQVLTISRSVQNRHDLLLRGNLGRFLFSFNANKRIYKGILLLSFFNRRRRRGLDAPYVRELHRLSVSRMVDVLANKGQSWVVTISPLHYPGKERNLTAGVIRSAGSHYGETC